MAEGTSVGSAFLDLVVRDTIEKQAAALTQKAAGVLEKGFASMGERAGKEFSASLHKGAEGAGQELAGTLGKSVSGVGKAAADSVEKLFLVRKYKRLAAGTLDVKKAKEYRAKVRDAQKAVREFVAQHGDVLRRERDTGAPDLPAGSRLDKPTGENSEPQQMAAAGNNWQGAEPAQHTEEELRELNQYAKEHGIRLYHRKPYQGDIDLLKSQIDIIEKIRDDFNHTDPLQLGWKRMDEDDFGETSKNHQQIWINALALFNREITEKNLAADDWLAANSAEGIAAHEMGHVLSGKIRNGKTGLDIYRETVYNVSGNRISEDEALNLLSTYVSGYSSSRSEKLNGNIFFDEIIPEMLSVHYTKANRYSEEFVRLLKEACER